ncbi:MAG: aminotransferase class I/II-fold pyridoxal phosphate-dependent enzyme [Anaerolineales bacterium]|nr:aminotransferase class I/II-fold pyridoxal phosphate-dependent enzyme [Anaerolineales bacterium]
MAQKPSTQAVHAGEDRRKPYGAVTTPIVQTSTYTFADTAEIIGFMQAKAGGQASVRDEYGRYTNPTQTAAEGKIAVLEGGEKALLFASGMSAITTIFSTLLSKGDHLLLVSGCYHRTREFTSAFLSRWGIETTVVPIDDPQAWEAAIRPATRMIFVETPTNPYLRVVDLDRLADFAQARKVTTVIDSTFATPINLRPLGHGIDLVVHSASKYLGGHNDLLAGVVVGSRDKLADIQAARGILGGISNPNDAYLLIRGLKTLDLRVRYQHQSGLQIAAFLEAHPAVSRVYYPGLESHPDHAVASRLMAGFGGVVSFEVLGGFEETGRVIDRLQIPYIGPTLGGVESIVQQPAALFSLDPDERRIAGLKDNLVRYALGIEAPEDLIADLGQALEAVGRPS